MFYRRIYFNASHEVELKPIHVACKANNLNEVEILLRNGANINSKCPRGNTPLHLAIKENSEQLTALLLNMGADVNAKDGSYSPLHIAAQVENKEIIKLLVKYKADVNVQNNKGQTVLHMAVEWANEDIIKFLLCNGVDPNKSKKTIFAKDPSDNKWYTVLDTATRKNLVEIAELLINYGADVNAIDGFGKRPICYAIVNANVAMFKLLLSHGADVKIDPYFLIDVANPYCRRRISPNKLENDVMRLEIAKQLLSSGIDVNVRDHYRQTALHYAAQHGNVKMVEALLEYNADVNAQGLYNTTPLYLSRNEIISQMLLQNGADINVVSKFGKTSLHAAVEKGHAEIVKVLLELNLDVNAQDAEHRTALHLSNNVIISQMLLQNGADINVVTKFGNTSLHVAVEKGHVEIVEALLELNPDVNAQDAEHRTALHLSQNVIISQMLLQNGADVNVKNKQGDTPLHVAASRGFSEIAETLLEYNANIDSVNEINATPLFLSVQYEKTAMSEMLLQRGAAVNTKCLEGGSPLCIASLADHYILIKLLLKYGADINCPNIFTETPIYRAIRQTNIAICKMLLDHNPDNNHIELIRYERRWKLTNQSEPYMLVIRHMLKLKALNQYVPFKILIATAIDEERESSIYNKCKEEVERMRHHKIGNTNISLYDLLTKCVKRIATYVTYRDNARDSEESRSTITEELFPLYYGMIVVKFEKVKDKAISLRNSEKCLNLLFHQWWPVCVTEKVFSYLADEDLRKLSHMYVSYFKG